MDNPIETSVRLAITLYPTEVEIVREVDEKRGLRNTSAALRQIIREWAEMSEERRAGADGGRADRN